MFFEPLGRDDGERLCDVKGDPWNPSHQIIGERWDPNNTAKCEGSPNTVSTSASVSAFFLPICGVGGALSRINGAHRLLPPSRLTQYPLNRLGNWPTTALFCSGETRVARARYAPLNATHTPFHRG